MLKSKLLDYINELKRKDGSDIHFAPNSSIAIRVHGKLVKLDKVLTSNDTKGLQRELINSLPVRTKTFIEERLKKYKNTGFSITLDDIRFRVNLSYIDDGFYIVMRKINDSPPSLEELGFSENALKGLKFIASRHSGLFLVVGATGSGKSTTLASIIRYINENYQKNIITLEDPIEYIHSPIKSQIIQKELGRDFDAFKFGLHSALREDPDVILVGEIRDEASLDLCLKASETGHLVLATLHTNSAVTSIQRLIAMSENPTLTRDRLSQTFLGALAQKLAPKKDGSGRVLIYEMLIADKGILAQIKEGKDIQVEASIDNTRYSNSFNRCIENRYREGYIDRETAYEVSLQPDKLVLGDISGNGKRELSGVKVIE